MAVTEFFDSSFGMKSLVPKMESRTAQASPLTVATNDFEVLTLPENTKRVDLYFQGTLASPLTAEVSMQIEEVDQTGSLTLTGTNTTRHFVLYTEGITELKIQAPVSAGLELGFICYTPPE